MKPTISHGQAILVALALSLFWQGAQGEPPVTFADARLFADSIMARIVDGNYEGAVELIRSRTVLPQSNLDLAPIQLDRQLTAFAEQFGPPVDIEFIRQEEAGQSLVRLTYLMKHQKAPIRWAFVFYKGDKGWVVADFKYDANFNAVFALSQ